MKIFLIGASLLGILLAGCSGNTEVSTKTPAKELYFRAIKAQEDDFFTRAEEAYTEITTTYAGTRIAAWAYLKLGDLGFQRKQWAEAETNYRLFLTQNPDSHLTPYVLNRLIALNYERNVQGFWFMASRDFDRDMEPNRRIVRDYQKFFFLYPQNAYIEDVRDSLVKARSDLASHEFIVGNYYFEREAYESAIHRYRYLLENYPDFPQTDQVVSRLIEAYQRTYQTELAEEMREALAIRKQLRNP